MWLRLRDVEEKNLSFSPPWELLTPMSSLRDPDPSLLLGDPGLLINLPRNWLSHCRGVWTHTAYLGGHSEQQITVYYASRSKGCRFPTRPPMTIGDTALYPLIHESLHVSYVPQVFSCVTQFYNIHVQKELTIRIVRGYMSKGYRCH